MSRRVRMARFVTECSEISQGKTRQTVSEAEDHTRNRNGQRMLSIHFDQ